MTGSISDKNRGRYTTANRKAWDEAAPIHRKLNHAKLLESFATPGYSTLHEHSVRCLREIGVRGKSVAQLCCNNGRDLISVKNLGAGRCVGFDASQPFVEQARELARVTGHTQIDFVVTDTYEIPLNHNDAYDIVMITVGVLCWMPDLDRFFEVATHLAKSGGYLFVEETHPVLMMYEEGKNGEPSYLAHPYFRTEPWKETTGLDYFSGVKYDSEPHYSFQYTLSEIAMGAFRAGLVLRHFAEFGYDISYLCRDLEHAVATPPMGMTMLWRKEDVGK